MISIPTNFKMDKDAFILFMFFVIFVFQINLQNTIGIFQYYDELLSLFLTVLFFLNILKGKTYVQKETVFCLVLIGIVITMGLISNFTAKVQTGLGPIGMDLINTFKCFMIFISVSSRQFSKKTIHEFIKVSSAFVRILIYCAFPLCLVNLVVDINMSYDVRYGIRSYQFIFGHAGMLNMICYLWVIVLSAALMFKEDRKKNYVALVLTMGLWASTLRSRAIMYMFVYIVLFTLVMVTKDIKFNLLTASGVGAFGFYIVKDQFDYYFYNPKTPRAILLKYGIKTMQTYFPIGSGFATYGSFAAAKYYSKLYFKYGFSHGYGLSFNDRQFLTDNYWPQIMAQYGIFGALIMLTILLLIFVIIVKCTKDNVYIKLGCYIGYICVALSTIATNSIAHFLSVALFFLLGVLCSRQLPDTEENL